MFKIVFFVVVVHKFVMCIYIYLAPPIEGLMSWLDGPNEK